MRRTRNRVWVKPPWVQIPPPPPRIPLFHKGILCFKLILMAVSIDGLGLTCRLNHERLRPQFVVVMPDLGQFLCSDFRKEHDLESCVAAKSYVTSGDVTCCCVWSLSIRRCSSASRRAGAIE